MTKNILYAPNVHTGGGVVLLKAFLEAWPHTLPLKLICDTRARHLIHLPENSEVQWCEPSLISRYKAEVSLQHMASDGDVVFCFHGLPPTKRVSGRLIVFLQNRNYLGLNSLFSFPLRTAIRIGIERLISKAFRHRVDWYIVQSETMALALHKWYAQTMFRNSRSPRVSILPFADQLPLHSQNTDLVYDFVYVADGVAHKNHANLIDAWKLLSQSGICPSLALTLPDRDISLVAMAEGAVSTDNVKILNLGQLSRDDVTKLYGASRALIFPSTSESFGLPLIEAREMGLPIIAGELDYVRDVCEPVETFDPESPRSIARAVRRFLDKRESMAPLLSPSQFVEKIVSFGDKK